MAVTQKIGRKLGNENTWSIGILAWMAVVAMVSLAILLSGPLFSPGRAVYAAPHRSNEPWLKIKCLEPLVEEGEDFRLEVRKKHDSDWPHPTMRVFWYTESITADESDYEHLYAERQSSNGSQSESGVMGRNFHTTEDLYSETAETFKVRFNNSVDHGHDGECIITISDDDGVGIYDLEITSEPRDITTASGDEVVAYGAGDVIEITAQFTGTVTTLNPDTGEHADHAGLYIQVGENRRVAKFLRGDGGDKLVFGYTVTEEDVDADGISVEAGGPGTGMYYNVNHRDGGLWAVRAPGGRINRIFHGLDDDRDHVVVRVPAEEPVDEEPVDDEPPTVPPTVPPIDNTITPPIPTPEPEEWLVSSLSIESNLRGMIDGELTEEDDGRDWFSFEAEGGNNYIIELKNKMIITGFDGTSGGYPSIQYVPGHLVDPSILEIVDEEGEQVLGERDQGGFIRNFARAFFTPDEDGTYYIAIGAGAQDRSGLGYYELSVRADDHADDDNVESGLVLRPGDSVTGVIDSDVPRDDPGLNSWDWLEAGDGEAVPIWGLESLDDRDVFWFEISEEGTYLLSVSDGPNDFGIWKTVDGTGHALNYDRNVPVASLEDEYSPGTYYVEVGTRYSSSGNTGSYKLSLERM